MAQNFVIIRAGSQLAKSKFNPNFNLEAHGRTAAVSPNRRRRQVKRER